MSYNEKQIEILETAEKLFAEKGFEGTSVREIAKAANINLASISYYFGSKDKLMEAIFEYRMGNSFVAFKAIQNDNSKSPLKKLEQMADLLIDRMFGKVDFHKIIVRRQLFNKADTVTKLLEKSRAENLILFNSIITEGQKQKIFSKKIDTPLFIISVVGAVNQMINTQDYYKKAHKLEKLTDTAFQLHINNVLKLYFKTIINTIMIHEK